MNAPSAGQVSQPILDNAVSAIPQLLTASGLDPSAGFQVVPAEAIARRHHPGVEVSLPLIITGVVDADGLLAVSSTLANAYADDHSVLIVGNDSAPRKLGELADLSLPDAPVTLLVPPLAPGSSFTDLQEIMAHLRAPGGCPWDREQTLASLRQDLLSEAVEVLEAIDLEQTGIDNSHHIAEELGDAMMAAVLLTQIAIDEGRFKMGEVMGHIVEKLIRRHPHVFAETEVDGVHDIVANWDAIKAQEKASKGLVSDGPLDGIPAQLPALEKARTMQSRASKAGLLDREALARSWPALAGLLDEETTEEELGRLLWTVVALAHTRGINAEDALRSYAVAYRAGLAGQALPAEQ